MGSPRSAGVRRTRAQAQAKTLLPSHAKMAAVDPLLALLAYWVAMTAAMLLSTMVPVLGRLSRYGKLAAPRPAGQTPARWPALPEVRTATAFRSYYWLACASSLGLLGAMSVSCRQARLGLRACLVLVDAAGSRTRSRFHSRGARSCAGAA